MSCYQNLLNVMGINFATEMISAVKSNETKLWRAVLSHALSDCMIPFSDRKSSLQKLEAHQWIMDNGEEFQKICYWADFEPTNVRLQYIQAIKLGKITFTERQLKWKKYNELYQRLKTVTDKEERKYLRKYVENLRKSVANSTLKIVSIIN